jgi:hypothetical protein
LSECRYHLCFGTSPLVLLLAAAGAAVGVVLLVMLLLPPCSRLASLPIPTAATNGKAMLGAGVRDLGGRPLGIVGPRLALRAPVLYGNRGPQSIQDSVAKQASGLNIKLLLLLLLLLLVAADAAAAGCCCWLLLLLLLLLGAAAAGC